MKTVHSLISFPKTFMSTNLLVFTEITFQLVEFCIFGIKYQSQNDKRPNKHNNGVDKKKIHSQVHSDHQLNQTYQMPAVTIQI